MSIACFIVLGLILLEAWIFDRDVFSPARAYLIAHSLALGIAFLAIHEAMTPFRSFTNMVYFGSGCAFLAGCAVPFLACRILYPQELGTERVDASGYNWTLHFMAALLVFILSLAGFWISWRGSGVIPLFAEDKPRAIVKFLQQSHLPSILFNMGFLAFILFVIAIIASPRSRAFRWLNAFLATVMLGIYSLAFVRNGILSAVFLAVAFYHFYRGRIRIIRLTGFGAVIGLAVLASSYFKFHNIQDKVGEEIDPGAVVEIGLKIPYSYIANNFWNLDYALNPENTHTRHPTTWGFTLISGLFEPIGWSPAYRESKGYEGNGHEKSIKVKGLNTTAYQWNLYKDFGFTGTLFLPFFFGIFSYIAYLKTRHRPTIFNSAFYGYLVFGIFLSYGGILWVESFYQLYGLLYLSLVTLLCQPSSWLAEWPARHPR